MDTGGFGVHQDALTGDRLKTELGACLEQRRRLRALLQPDAPDTGSRGLANNLDALLGRYDDKHAANRLLDVGQGAMAAVAVHDIRLTVDRVDAIALPAQLARRQVPNPLPDRDTPTTASAGWARKSSMSCLEVMTDAPHCC